MDTERLIDTLAAEGAKKPLPHPFRQGAPWLAGALAYVGLVSAVGGFRPDLAVRLADVRFSTELALLIAMTLTAALAALYLLRPDGFQKPKMPFVPLGFTALWAVTAFAGADFSGLPTSVRKLSDCHFDCVLHILLFALPPGLAMAAIVRSGAPVRFGWAGGMIVLSVSALAYLFMRLIETDDDPVHLLLWHALPTVALCVLGAAAGRWLLRRG